LGGVDIHNLENSLLPLIFHMWWEFLASKNITESDNITHNGNKFIMTTKKHAHLEHILYYSLSGLTPCSRVVLERLTVTQQMKTFLGFHGPWRVIVKSTVFWDVAPCSGRHSPVYMEEHVYSPNLQGQRVNQASIPLTLKLETVCFFEMSVDFYQTTLHDIPEDNTLHSCYFQNHKSWQLLLCSQQGTEEDIQI
jgi:hypothetical protein